MATTTPSKNRVQEIVELHEGIVQSMRRSVQDAIRIGELLTEVKADPVMRGEFLRWIDRDLPFKKSTAESYMKLWEHRSEIPNVGNLQDARRRIEQLEDQARQGERQRKAPPAEEEQQADAEFEERKRKANEERQVETDRPGEPTREHSRLDDVIAAVLAEPPKHDDLKLADMRANIGQGQVFTVLKEYVDSFEGPNRQLEAIYNLLRYLKRAAIELQPKTREASA